MKKVLRIACTGAGVLSLKSLSEFQGGLKKRTDNDINLIRKSLERYGFSFPVFVWKHSKKNYCLDGHGRMAALKEMVAEGWEVPSLPVAYIEAKDEAEAKNKLLRLNSQYGKITQESALKFTDTLSIEWEEIRLPVGDLIMVTPDFEPVGIEDQGRLDEKAKVKCPECGHEFSP